jgi:hypothetical protein
MRAHSLGPLKPNQEEELDSSWCWSSQFLLLMRRQARGSWQARRLAPGQAIKRAREFMRSGPRRKLGRMLVYEFFERYQFRVELELQEGLDLKLSDSLSSDAHLIADLFQGHRLALKTKPHPNYIR